MKHIFIQKPCSENWSAMSPTQQGAFCAHCEKEVTDFTTLTQNEIKHTLFQHTAGELCGRFREQQLVTLNAEIDAFTFRSTKSLQSALVFSLIVVFGLTLFSCSNEQQQQEVEQLRSTAKNVLKEMQAGSLTEDKAVLDKNSALTEVNLLQHVEKELLAPEEIVFIERDTMYSDLKEELTYLERPIYLGGVGYRDYVVMEEIMPQMIQQAETDANGIPYPTAFDALVYPNPTNGLATFKLDIPVKQRFAINIFNMNGQLVQSLTDQELDRGTFRQEIDLSEQPTGMYLVTILSADFKKTVRISKL